MKARYEITDLRSKDGFAMAATLGVLTLLSVLVISVFANAMASFRSGMTDLEKSRTYFAAEAAAESAMAQLALVLEDAVIEDEELSSIVPPTLEGFTFDDFSVVRDGTVETERITDGPFAGLFSRTQVVEITAEAVSSDYTRSAIMVTAKAQAIPIFQFGVFFEKDLEITNGPRLDFDGWVHSNGNIFLNSANQYFGDVITTPNNVCKDRKDKHGVHTGMWIADATATYNNLNFDSRTIPDPNSFRTASDAAFDNRLKTSAYGVDSLTVPLPTGVSPTVLYEPRNASDTPLERQSKFAWKADWYIEVDLSALDGSGGGGGGAPFAVLSSHLEDLIASFGPGPVTDALEDALTLVNDALICINVPDEPCALDKLEDAKDKVKDAKNAGMPGSEQGALISEINAVKNDIQQGGNGQNGGGNGPNLCDDAITHTRPAGAAVPSASECKNIFSFNYDKWYEGREQRYVDVVDINVDQLFNWLNGGNRSAATMYITIDGTNPGQDPEGDGTYPVIRLINASSLDAPITFSTNHPLYVQGHYNNNAAWYPSALVADAITFLSTVWDDADHQAATQIRPTAADTEIYAAIMAGHSGTPCDHEVAGCGATSPYGGGLENFPRFLEDWNPEILLFRGSLVSLTFSQQSTGLWGNGPYYRPPVRDWEFDMRFDQPENMPPGTPVVGNVIHTAFRPIF